MKIPATTRSTVRHRIFEVRPLTSGMLPAVRSSAFGVGRSAPCSRILSELGVALISSSATPPIRLRARTHPEAALPCAAVGQLPGWRYNRGCCSRQRLLFPATTPDSTGPSDNVDFVFMDCQHVV